MLEGIGHGGRSARNQRWHHLSRTLRFLWELGAREMILMGLATLVSGLVPVASVFCIRGLMDSAVGTIRGATPLSRTIGWLGALMAASYASWALPAVQTWFSRTIQERLRARAQERLLQKATRLSLEDFERPALHDRLHRAQEGPDNHLVRLVEFLFPLPSHLIAAIGLLAYLGSTRAWLPLLLLAGIVPTHLISHRFIGKRYLLTLRHTPLQRRLDYLSNLILRRDTAAEIRLFGLQKYLFNKRQSLFFDMREDRLRLEYELTRSITASAVGDQMAYGLVITGIVALIAMLSALGALIIWLSLYDGYIYYQDCLKDCRLAQAATEQRLRQITASDGLTRQPWHELNNFGFYEHKPPTPMSMFVRGLEPTLGRSISNVNTLPQRLRRSPAEMEWFLGIFPPLDLGLVVQVVLSLFVLLLTYDAVCGEKEAGTLRLTATFSIPRHKLLIGRE